MQVYPWPTIDLIIDSDWKGTLELINPTSASSINSLGKQPDPGPLIVVPFNSRSLVLNSLNLVAVSGVSIPKIKLFSTDSFSPIYFLGSRGGNFKSITFNAVSGLFVGRDVTFAKDSLVSINLPQGDVLLNTVSPISTNIETLYSSTAPTILDAEVVFVGRTSFIVRLLTLNFRNLVPLDSFLTLQAMSPSPPIQECIKSSGLAVDDFRGISTPSNISFFCSPKFTEASTGENPFFYNMLLNYFGGSIPLPYIFQVNVDISNSAVAINNLFIKQSNLSVLPTPSALPNNLCAVGAQAASRQNTVTSSGFRPSTNPQNQAIFIAFSNENLPNVKVSCSSARSLYLGSHPYSDGRTPSPLTLLGSKSFFMLFLLKCCMS